MQEGLNSLNPYNIFSEHENKYFFLTKAAVPYIAYFTESAGYFADYPEFDNDIFNFSFEPFGEYRKALYQGKRASKVLRQSYDSKILDTVIKILLQFFEMNPRKVILFICEASDQLDHCRHRYFQRCFLRTQKSIGNPISKYDLVITGEGYVSIFISDNHPFYKKIVKSFYEIPQRIALDKNDS